MPRIPEDAKEYINSEFARRLEEGDPPFIDVLIETKPGKADEIASQIQAIDGVSIGSAGIINGEFIPATIPDPMIAEIARLDGVELIHQDQQAGVMNQNVQINDIPFLTADSDPIRQTLSNALYSAFESEDPYVGRPRISEVEVPRFNFAQIPPGDPIETLATASDQFAGTGISGEKIIPTADAVDWIRDTGLTDGAVDGSTGVAIIDTGHTPVPEVNRTDVPRLESWVPGEPPLDGMGHGTWVTNMIVGTNSPGVWGSVEGVAPGTDYGHFKALNTFPGVGQTSWILKCMERALDWGADVISMSLGGTQQGPVDEDPQSRFIRKNCKENAGDDEGAIFVVASGNAGPDKWTIGSPGVAPKALTVGAWSLTDASPAVFSSRGPQGSWYGDNQEQFQEDLSEYNTSEFVKPDVVAPGGGRKNSDLASEADELLFQASVGWYDGMKDGLKDNRANMKGSSMATPAVAGLVKRLYDAGIVDTAAEVKQVAAENAPVGEYEDAAAGANETVEGKNIAVGFGPLRESAFTPEE